MALFWSVLCVCGVVGLLGFSYQRLSALRRCELWAAPYLARRLASVAPQLPADGLEEATRELRWQLRQPSLVPRGCAKAAFWLGASSALMQAARQLGAADARDWLAPVLCLGSGCVGALGCSLIGRLAETQAQRLRDAWNALIRRSTRDVRT
jgi:hypothetical protein